MLSLSYQHHISIHEYEYMQYIFDTQVSHAITLLHYSIQPRVFARWFFSPRRE